MSRTLIRSEFDYSSLGKELRGKLVSLANNIKHSAKAHVKNAVDMGAFIFEANELLAKHGRESIFGDWIQKTCHISRTTAYNYMNAWQRFGNCSRLEQFTLESMYYLSADKVPTEAIDTAINLAEKGELITMARATELKNRFKSNGSAADHPAEHQGSPEPGPQSQSAAPHQELDKPEAGDSLGAAPDRTDDPPVGNLTTQDLDAQRLIRAIDGAFKVLATDIDLLHKLMPWGDREAIINSLDIAYSSYRKWKRSKVAA